MLIEVCNICKNPLSGNEIFENDFKVKVKLVQTKPDIFDGYYKKKFKLCDHCKTAIAIAIKQYSEFMRDNKQAELTPKFYIAEGNVKEAHS